jgi:hypothetical protein
LSSSCSPLNIFPAASSAPTPDPDKDERSW